MRIGQKKRAVYSIQRLSLGFCYKENRSSSSLFSYCIVSLVVCCVCVCVLAEPHTSMSDAHGKKEEKIFYGKKHIYMENNIILMEYNDVFMENSKIMYLITTD